VLDLRLYRFAESAFERELARFRPDLVGFTAYSHESGRMKRLAGTVRRSLPKTRIVVGGHHATVAPADCNIPDIDYIVRGEGCAPFGALVAALAKGDEPEGVANCCSPATASTKRHPKYGPAIPTRAPSRSRAAICGTADPTTASGSARIRATGRCCFPAWRWRAPPTAAR
jgi:radical SAM superfamily enzyme YgiQ (UPF0313 family)